MLVPFNMHIENWNPIACCLRIYLYNNIDADYPKYLINGRTYIQHRSPSWFKNVAEVKKKTQ